MVRVFFSVAVCLAAVTALAEARPRGTQGAIHDTQLNLGTVDITAGTLINLFKAVSVTYNTVADAALVDAEGYLNGTPAGNVGLDFGTTASTFTPGAYKLVWDAGFQFASLRFSSAFTSCTTVNATLSACTGTGTTITTTGGAGSVTFTLSSGGFSANFLAGGAVSHTLGAKIALYRVSDETDYLAGEYWTPEQRALITALGPSTIRTMGWVQKASGNFNGEVKWSYRIKPESFSWNARQIIPAVWAGAIACVCGGGTDTYTVTAPDSDVIVGTIANANTGTSPTLNGIPIRTNGSASISVGSPSGASYPITVGIGTFTYDAILNVYLYNSNGIASSIPIEAAVQLANKTGKNLWPVIGALANDDYATQWGTTVCGSLSGTFYPEYSNEMWLDQWPQTLWARARGVALGFAASSNRDVGGWYGLRVREIMGTLLPAACSGQLSRLKPVLMANAANDSTMPPYRMRGQDLAPSGVSTGTGNAAYVSYTGGANYTTVGQRPIDVVSVTGQAPYATGTNLCFAPDVVGSCAVNANNLPFLQALVNAQEAGDTATVISMIDNDVRRGRILIQSVTCSGTTCTTPLAHSFTANTTRIVFEASGGTLYSGLDSTRLYRVSSTPTSTTFTMQAYDSTGEAAGASVNVGSAGTGSVTVGNAQSRNLLNNGNQYEQWMESTAASFDSDRASLGKAPLEVRMYEANIEVKGPTAAQCLTIGITTVPPDATGALCASEITSAVATWVASSAANATTQAYFKQFMGLDSAFTPTFGVMPHSRAPSWLVTMCDIDYRLLLGCLPTSTPNGYYSGFRAWSRGD